MFSVYGGGGVKTFKQDDQDWVINKFYGVNDPSDPGECNKRYIRKNETRPSGRHCADGTSQAPAGPGIILEAGSYAGTNLSSDFCKEEQVIDPVLSSNKMTEVKVGWCGNSYSSTFNCSGNLCGGINNYKLEILTPVSYKFVMPSATGVFTKVSGSTTGSGSNIVLKRGNYKGSNLNASFCTQNQIVDPIVQNGNMPRVTFGWCGNANSAVFTCQGRTCTGSSFTVEVLSDSSYTFDVNGHKATYTWNSASVTP
jgi:hypothetical protein